MSSFPVPAAPGCTDTSPVPRSCSSSHMFALTLTTVHLPQECSLRPSEMPSAMPSAAFQGRTFIKSMHSMKEEADTGLLCTILSSSWHMVDGLKKKWIWMVWKSIHPGPQRINYLFLVICCVLPWLYPPVLLWRNALHRLYRSEQASVLAFCMSENKDFNSITFFVWTITSDRACIFNEGNSSLTYGNKRTENPMQP